MAFDFVILDGPLTHAKKGNFRKIINTETMKRFWMKDSYHATDAVIDVNRDKEYCRNAFPATHDISVAVGFEKK